MTWCSSTTLHDRSIPQVPSMRLRERSRTNSPARRSPIRSRTSSMARLRMRSVSTSDRISSSAASSEARSPRARRSTRRGAGAAGARVFCPPTGRRVVMRVTSRFPRNSPLIPEGFSVAGKPPARTRGKKRCLDHKPWKLRPLSERGFFAGAPSERTISRVLWSDMFHLERRESETHESGMRQWHRPWFWRLPAALAFTLVASLAVAGPPDTSDRRATEANITRVTTSLLASSQLAHHPLDEQLAGKLLDRYMDALDGTRSLFLRSDVEELAPLRATLAQATRADGDTQPAHRIFARFLERLHEQVTFDSQVLKAGHLDFRGKERVEIDREHAERPRDLAAAHDLWKLQLQAEGLGEKLGEKPPKDIAAALIRRHELQLKTMSELADDEVLEIYLDALAHVYDPHSDYLDKESMESLSISMNLSLFGIGATLETEDGFCTIRELVPGSPAALSGALKPGDRIVAVAQANAAPVDVTSMPLTRIVELIRGPKGSIVTLTILPPAGATKTVRLTRAQVKLEDQQAKARIVDLPRSGGPALRLGVIDLPSFYSGAEDNGSHGATADVARLLGKLSEEKVRGVVLDLRRNGGGSLEEAIDLTSLFVGGGPVVQTRDANNAIEVDADKGAVVRYAGPLVVLISRFSASASEIVAGALQDYGRAV